MKHIYSNTPNVMDSESILSRYVTYRGGCWQWNGHLDTQGYGRVKISGRTWLAHRLMWKLLIGDPPAVLHHECENRACVNVGEHIFASDKERNQQSGFRNRRQECRNGHDDWYIARSGKRWCRACGYERKKRTQIEKGI